MTSQSRYSKRPHYLFTILLTFFFSFSSLGAKDETVFELKDGDRVVFVGNTFVEREIDYGHIEAALTTYWPNRSITFRNLGWSGDDARGRSRRFFGPVEDGFNHLKTHVEGLKPTVIFVVYGAMESYEGRAGLSDFEDNMNTLLDMLSKTRARIVLVSTIPQENMGPPLPDPKLNNQNLKLYAESIRSLAQKRNHWFIDLYGHMETAMKQSKEPLTDNGIHLNDEGYRVAARGILAGMGLVAKPNILQVDARGNLISMSGTNLQQIQPIGNGLLLTLSDESLNADQPLRLSVLDLFAGNYTIRINGRNLGTYSSQQWASGVELPWTPEVEQAGLLTKTIFTKNEFYFHKWRPQNETYIRGFRKHEQGQNAVELEQFDQFIEKEELKIKDLKQPRFYTLQLQREPKR
ncbi:MAG: SGNH/GDSL hydrolase family protein [Verrucomicrobia bacterium]|nr:SGNH/GDSL hydrolase family protein [Verrucomicrobiota bacterium]